MNYKKIRADVIEVLQGMCKGATPKEVAAIEYAICGLQNELVWHDLKKDPTDLPAMPDPLEFAPRYIAVTEREVMGEPYDSVQLLPYAAGWNTLIYTDGTISKTCEMHGITRWAEIPNIRW